MTLFDFMSTHPVVTVILAFLAYLAVETTVANICTAVMRLWGRK